MLTSRQRLLLLAPLALLMFPFLLWPIAYGFVLTFTNAGPFQPTPRFIGLSNYLNMISDNVFRTALINMVVFSFVTVLVETIIGTAVLSFCANPFADGHCSVWYSCCRGC